MSLIKAQGSSGSHFPALAGLTELPSFSQASLIETSLEVRKTNFENLLREFQSWLDYTRNKVIVLKRKNVSQPSENDIKILEWKHRWKRSYMSSWKHRIEDWLENFYDQKHFIHIVITVPRVFDIDYYMRQLKKTWKSLQDLLTKRKGKFDFITVLEPHRDGYPHLHALIFCDWYLISQQELSEYLSSKGVGYVCYIKRYWAHCYGRRPIKYLSKYLSKYWKPSEWTKSFMIFSAYLWKTHTRTISTSNSLLRGVKIVKKPEWIKWFVCDLLDLDTMLNLGGVDPHKIRIPKFLLSPHET